MAPRGVKETAGWRTAARVDPGSDRVQGRADGAVATSRLGGSWIGMQRPIHLVPGAGEDVRTVPPPFEAFVAEHQTRLFGALCLITGDRFEAEEIVQEAFLRVFERWERVSAMDEPAGYLFRVAMNVFRTRRRRAALAVRRADRRRAVAEDEFALADDRETVLHGLAQVSEDQRAALVVTALYGLSSEEAGKVLGVKPSTVRARATRARAALRDAIGEDR